MSVVNLGISDILVLAGLTGLVGEIVLTAAAVVAAIVAWRKESR
jgi:hypothetical protein